MLGEPSAQEAGTRARTQPGDAIIFPNTSGLCLNELKLPSHTSNIHCFPLRWVTVDSE